MASFSGRMVNFMTRRLPRVAARATNRQVTQFRASDGAKGSKLMGKPTMVLDVVGRKSGESRPVMLMHIEHEDGLLVVGSRGGHPHSPNWYLNLMAAGGGSVEVGADRWDVTAEEIAGGDERNKAWAVATAAYPDYASYQELTDRQIPVARLRRVG